MGSHFSPTAESFGVSAQIGSGVVRGGPEARFHEGSTRVPRGFHEVARAAGWYEPLLGISLEPFFFGGGPRCGWGFKGKPKGHTTILS